jgi:hypothetical protein
MYCTRPLGLIKIYLHSRFISIIMRIWNSLKYNRKGSKNEDQIKRYERVRIKEDSKIDKISALKQERTKQMIWNY